MASVCNAVRAVTGAPGKRGERRTTSAAGSQWPAWSSAGPAGDQERGHDSTQLEGRLEKELGNEDVGGGANNQGAICEKKCFFVA